MKRGEVWWVNFEPAVGGEVRKQRPAVIVSNDAANNRMHAEAATTSSEANGDNQLLPGATSPRMKS